MFWINSSVQLCMDVENSRENAFYCMNMICTKYSDSDELKLSYHVL